MKEKALSLLLALAMALAVLPLSASADDTAQAPDARAPSCEREENAAVRSAATGQGFADLASAAAQAAEGDTLVLQNDLILYEPLVLEKPSPSTAAATPFTAPACPPAARRASR